MRNAIARGDVVGPRMYVVGAYVTITGGGGALTGFVPDVKLRKTCDLVRQTVPGKCAESFASLQAIPSATINAACLLDKRSELGSIAKGKRADLIAVKGNPIENINLLEKVDFVMKDGQLYF